MKSKFEQVFFIVCLYLYSSWRSYYQEGEVWIQVTSVTLPYLCAFPTPGSVFSSAYVLVQFVLYDLRLEVIVAFVDIGYNC